MEREVDWRWSLLVAAIGSLLVSLPAAVRSADASASFVACWMALWGTSALVVGPTSAALGHWRPRQVMSGAPATLLLGALVASGPLMVFAELLKRSTHHRPLGAVTFAVVAAVVLLGALAVVARLRSLAASSVSSRARRSWRGVLIGLVVVASLLTARGLVSTLGVAPVRAGLLDAALIAALMLAAAWVRPMRVPALRYVAANRYVGPGVWVAVVAVGLITLRAVPDVSARVQSAGPVLAAFSGWVTHS